MQIPCEACLIFDNQLVLINVVFGLSGPSFVVGLPGCSYTPTVCITSMHGQTCQASCKLHSSLGTWPAFAMASSSCSGLLASVHLCSLFDTFTVLSSVNRKLDGLPCSQEVSILLLYQNQLVGSLSKDSTMMITERADRKRVGALGCFGSVVWNMNHSKP